MSTTDLRADAILHWLTDTLDLKVTQFQIASSDASFRRYFRAIHDQGRHIIMDAPPETENTEAFVRIAALFKSAYINVPDIYQQDNQQGFLLLEDFGDDCLLDKLNDSNADTLYHCAFQSLYRLQSDAELLDASLPHYDLALLERELEIFYHWFLKQQLGLSIADDIKQQFNTVLIESALQQPQTCVHRDFHSRNLMYLSNNDLGLLDFQDAVIGPISYDLVSLLRDCYIDWPEHKVEKWMSEFYQHLSSNSIIDCTLEEYRRWFDLMGLQRHLKAIGIFSRLNLRDNKTSYLADIPRTLNYVTQVCDKYPELKPFNLFLQSDILPRYRKQL